MNHRVRLLHLQRMFLSLTPCYSTCRISVSVCRYLSDEAIPKGLSGETSPACSQGQRSNQLGPQKGNASLPFSALVQGPFRWAHCFRWAHPFLGTSSAPPSPELNPISLEQGTQQFGGVCATATRGTLTWGVFHLFLLCQTGPVTLPHVPRLPLESQVCHVANMSQQRGNRLYYL